MSAHLHFAENAFALHLFLQRAKRLVNIVVAYENLHVDPNFLLNDGKWRNTTFPFRDASSRIRAA